MNLKYELDQKSSLSLRPHINNADIEYCIPYDINERGSYVDGYLVITKKNAFVLCDGIFISKHEIDEGTKYKSKETGSVGIMEFRRQGDTEWYPLVHYTLEHMKRMGHAEGILNSFAENKPVKITRMEDEIKCPTCRRNFLRGTKTCPNCDNKFTVYKRIFEAIAKNWLLYVGVFALFIVDSILLIIQPMFSKGLIDDAIKPMSEGIIDPDFNKILFFVLLIGGASLLSMINRIVSGIVANKAGASLSRDLRTMVYKKIQSLSIGFIDSSKVGDMMNRVNNDTDRLRSFIQDFLLPAMNDMLLLAFLVFYIFSTNWLLGLFIILPLPIIGLIMKWTWGQFHRRFSIQWIKMDKMQSTLNNILNGIRVVKAFGQEDREVAKFNRDAQQVRETTAKNEQFFYTMIPFIQFIFRSGGFLVTFYTGYLIINGRFTIGQMTQFGVYTMYFYNKLGWLVRMPNKLSDTANAAQRIYQIIDQKIEIDENVNAKETEIIGKVDCKNMTFGYLSYRPVLKDINLEVKEGEMIGIVGHSGAGKSTFINLLMRLYDVDDGTMNIDDLDIRELSLTSYKKQIGVVLQEAFLFSGTVMQNVMYSKPDATLDEIITATKIANAHDFIVQLPNGYDTKVGEKGYSLSGGERQRISIARAVLNNPKILILDEATASVDTETEAVIQEAFSRLIKGRTTFAIAHRLSTLKNANRIMVIDKGNLAEIGSHAELMEQKGIYYGLVLAQREMSRIKAI